MKKVKISLFLTSEQISKLEKYGDGTLTNSINAFLKEALDGKDHDKSTD